MEQIVRIVSVGELKESTFTTRQGEQKLLVKREFIINDGFVTRLALWVMPSNSYQMIEKSMGRKKVQKESPLEKWGYILQDFEGEIEVPTLVDYCYDWCARQCEIAALEDDQLIDYFRKRVPIYMMRYTIPRIIMREYDNYRRTGKWTVRKSDLAFAQLIGDYLMYIQIYLFGSKLENAKEKQLEDARPRQRKSKFQAFFESLGDTFTREEIAVNYKNEKTTLTVIGRLINAKLIKRVGKDKYQKLAESLDSVVAFDNNS